MDAAVTVWLADARCAARLRADLLDPAERARRAGLARSADRDRFTVAAVLLRLAVAGAAGTRPHDVRVERDCDRCGAPHGRPRVPSTGLEVSVSHAHRVVAVAVSRCGPVGVDVEHAVPRDVTGLARVALGPGEHAAGPREFYTYWCRKEAVVKATGDGLRMPVVDVLVSPPDRPPRLLRYGDRTLGCRLADLCWDGLRAGVPLREYVGALATLDDGGGGPGSPEPLEPRLRWLDDGSVNRLAGEGAATTGMPPRAPAGRPGIPSL